MILAVLLLSPMACWAAPFDGTWKTDMKTVKITGKPDVYLLKNGTYTCSTCTPELKVAADGKPHKVVGHSYYDEVTVTVTDAQSIEIHSTLAGNKTADRIVTVSKDGNSLTEEFTDYTGTKPASAKFASKRVAPAPPGAHAISGSWKPDEENTTMSADLLTVTFQETPEGLKMTTPTGQSYDAHFDGKEYLTSGDPGKTMVSLKKISANKIEETDTRQGKVTDVYVWEVASDGKTMHATDQIKQAGQAMSFTLDKQ